MLANKVLNLDLEWFSNISFNHCDMITEVKTAKFAEKSVIEKHVQPSWLLKAVNCIDLATLVGCETPEDISKLCKQAVSPFSCITDFDVTKIQHLLEGNKVHCAAVCVYPSRIEDASAALAKLGAEKDVLVAAVAAGFPSGQFSLHTRIAEIYHAVGTGAREIDVVIDRSLVRCGLWSQLYSELCEMRKACGQTPLKVILSVTECGGWTNIYKASIIAMYAGADFIKTSTGKELIPVSIHEGFVMCQAIRDFHNRTGVKVGLKPAGGIRSDEQAVSWMLMLQEVLGDEWVDPKLFRIGTSGASSLITSIAQTLLKC